MLTYFTHLFTHLQHYSEYNPHTFPKYKMHDLIYMLSHVPMTPASVMLSLLTAGSQNRWSINMSNQHTTYFPKFF